LQWSRTTAATNMSIKLLLKRAKIRAGCKHLNHYENNARCRHCDLWTLHIT